MVLSEALARQLILEHYRNSRHRGELPTATHTASVVNEVCGDRIALQLEIDGDRIVDVSFAGHGCSLSQAAVSMLSAALQGRTVQEADALQLAFQSMVRGSDADSQLGDLRALASIGRYPNRVRCASLGWEAWSTIREALTSG